jgi:Na+/H+ antiporter NhaD/arsenite permease-like protein
MYFLMIIIFVLGYLMIALEHPLKIDKAAPAILTGVICWTLLIIGQETLLPTAAEEHFLEESLLRHVGEIAEILFFLLGAMTIVELVDAHEGFEVVTQKITTQNKIRLLWILCITTFFFSAILDNLTTSIVMAALLRKLIVKKEDLWFFAGMIVIAANAGGAWSPIGDVTTIMLWIGGQVTATNIIMEVFLPSAVCLLVPLLVLSFTTKGEIESPEKPKRLEGEREKVTNFEKTLIFWMGVGGLLFVPVFKNLTHLPPFMGMLLSLGILWVTTEILHRNKSKSHKDGLAVAHVIRRVDTPSVLFFLGILLAVASLQTAGHLGQLATFLDETFGNIYIVKI